ncbi:hypothetical protein NFI96_026094, partial [Prochilodus magdalenae]
VRRGGSQCITGSKCRAPENEKKVIQKLLGSLRRLKEGNTGRAGKFNGKPCSALLDSGSQVTIIFEEWHQKHLTDVPIQPVSGLAVWDLSESSYPYKRYVVVNVQLPKELVGVQETISVLALVCPGPRSPDQTPVTLGTNANLFQRLSQLCKEAHGLDIAPALGLNKAFTMAAKTLPDAGYRGQDEAVGQIIWKGPEPLCIPASSTDCVQCTIDPEQFKFADTPIPIYWKNRLKQKLSRSTKVFSVEEWDVGLAQGVEHRIKLHDPCPFQELVRTLAPADIDNVRRHIQDLLAAGIIKESRSPYASPVVIERKKNRSVRMCIDYRTLNSRTVPDQYITPRVDDTLDRLTGSKWLTVLDLRSGYYQITFAEEDQEKTI